MAASQVLERSTVDRLASWDPGLPLLATALHSTARTGWRLHDVRWDPGERCRLVFDVDRPGYSNTFVALDVTPTAWSRFDYRQDFQLPGVTTAADPVAAARLLASAVREPVHTCRVTPVRYRPGSRCVLRYDVTTGSSTATTASFYAKVFPADRFEEAHALSARVTGLGGQRLAAELVSAWPECATLVTRAIDGRPLSRALADPTVPIDVRVALVDRLGGLLATFHTLRLPAPARSTDDQLSALTVLQPAIDAAAPVLGRRFSAARDRLRSRIPVAGPTVLSHAGFRPGQTVLGRSRRLTILDLDGLCWGDSARDLSTALAHLFWQGVHEFRDRSVVERYQAALLAGYRDRGGQVDAASLQWWGAAALLQVAGRRYRRLEVPDWDSVPALVSAAENLLSAPARSASRADGIGLLADPRRMTRVLAAGLSISAPADHLTVTSAEVLASAPGRRHVVRYAVRGLDGRQSVDLIGKAFAEPQRARLLHEHLQTLWSGPFHSGHFQVPMPFTYLPEHRLVLYRAATGVAVSQLPDGPATGGAVRDAARWLARLHGSDVRLPRSLDLRHEATNTLHWADLVGRHDPTLRASARNLAAGWSQAVGKPGNGPVPIHKDYHAGHVLIGDNVVVVVDLDEARQGDPALDLAHFCVYLAWQRGDAQPLIDTFLREYALATGWRDGGELAAYSAYSWMKIAKQLAVGSGPRQPAIPAAATTVADAVEKGLACLDR